MDYSNKFPIKKCESSIEKTPHLRGCSNKQHFNKKPENTPYKNKNKMVSATT